MSRSQALGVQSEVSLSQGTIRYRERGAGAPVVFIHGLLVNGDLWRKVVPEIAPGFRCITPDFPLGSHSVAMRADADLSIGGLAKLIAEFLETLDLKDVTIVANDTGGALTQVLITKYPERVGRVAFTSCDAYDNFLPLMFRPLQWLARAPAVLKLTLQPLRLRALQRLPFAFGWLSKRPVDREATSSYLGSLFSDPDVLRDVSKVLADISPRYTNEAATRFGEFRGPVLLAWSSEDRFFPVSDARRLQAAFADARLELIEDCYTFSAEDQPARLAEVLNDFFGSTTVGAG